MSAVLSELHPSDQLFVLNKQVLGEHMESNLAFLEGMICFLILYTLACVFLALLYILSQAIT